MIPNMNSPYKGFATIIVILVVIGALASLAFTNSDLTNFMTNSAKADGIRQQNAVQQQIDAINTENYKTVEQAKTQAQLDQIAADTATYKKLQTALEAKTSRQQAALEVETSRLFDYGKIAVSIILAVCFSAILLILTVQFTRSRLVLVQAQAQAKRIDTRQDPIQLKEQIERARQRELMNRESYLRQTQTAIVPAFYPEEAPISWEDIRQQFAEARKNRKAN
jgi:hypothetical protein